MGSKRGLKRKAGKADNTNSPDPYLTLQSPRSQVLSTVPTRRQGGVVKKVELAVTAKAGVFPSADLSGFTLFRVVFAEEEGAEEASVVSK